MQNSERDRSTYSQASQKTDRSANDSGHHITSAKSCYWLTSRRVHTIKPPILLCQWSTSVLDFKLSDSSDVQWLNQSGISDVPFSFRLSVSRSLKNENNLKLSFKHLSRPTLISRTQKCDRLVDFYKTDVQVFPSSGIRRATNLYKFNNVRDKSRASIFKVKHSNEWGVTGNDATLLLEMMLYCYWRWCYIVTGDYGILLL
jgi:hypothetical protein